MSPQVLQDAFTRCANVISSASLQDDTAVMVCTQITRYYSVAAQFEGCREKIQEHSGIIKDLCRILYFKVYDILIFIK